MKPTAYILWAICTCIGYLTGDIRGGIIGLTIGLTISFLASVFQAKR